MIMMTVKVRLDIVIIEVVCMEVDYDDDDDDGLFSMIVNMVYIVVTVVICHIANPDIC
jgi:hypothetical protein